MSRILCTLALVCAAAGCSDRAEGRARAEDRAQACESGGDRCGTYDCCHVDVPACDTLLSQCPAILPGSERRQATPFATVAVYERAVDLSPELVETVAGPVQAPAWFASDCAARVEGYGGKRAAPLRTSSMIAADPAPAMTCSCVARHRVEAQLLKYTERQPAACRDGEQCRAASVWLGCAPGHGGLEANGCCYDEFASLSDLVDHEKTRECVLAEARASCPRGERAWACGEEVVCAPAPAQACDRVCSR